MQKLIGSKSHAVLDYATSGVFFALAARYRETNPAASLLAFVNGTAVLGLSLLTDYPGGLFPAVSFRTHGVVDAVQAAMSATGPALLGFADAPEARVFYSQAATEAAVIAATDFSNGDPY